MEMMVKIAEVHKYLGAEEKYPTKMSRSVLRYKIRRLIKAGIVEGSSGVVKLESLKEYFTFEVNILENYISIVEFSKMFGLTNDTSRTKKNLEKLRIESIFEYIVLDYGINNCAFYISKSSVEQFLRDYIPMDELYNEFDIRNDSWYGRFEKFGIKPVCLSTQKRFISKSEFEFFKEKFKFNLSDYYSLDEFKQILLLPVQQNFLEVVKEYDLKPKRINRNKYFKKEIVDALKARQYELREKYLSGEEARKLADAEGFVFIETYIEGEPVDSLLRPFFKKKRVCFLKETFEVWLEERRKKEDFFLIKMGSDFDTFKHRLKVKKVDIDRLGPFTSETWMNFISGKLAKSTANLETMDFNINRYIYCTEQLIDLVSSTKRREIYSVTSNDINTLFNEITKRNANEIYLYVKKVYYQLKRQKIEAFDLNKINNPFKFHKEHQDKSIYEYEMYKKVYNYAKDITLHKERTIKDTLNIIAGFKGKWVKHYAASWLYVLLHLNNAWRHSDVIIFPQVDLTGTQIVDLNWMLENDLSDEDIDYIIKQVYRSEFIISKTQVKNYFFCSEELKKPFAIAIAICQLRTNAMSPLSKSIINFNNKNNHFSENRRNNFFDLFEKEEFIFSSRKMNRSLLSYIYVILSKMQKGTTGLKTIQKMRGHLEQETVNFYVDIPEDELNFLTKQLFARGSFGFIYDTFLDILQGGECDLEKRTTEIYFLKNYLGDISKIEEIASFLNVIQLDRRAILDRILSMGLDEALKFVNKIETNQLPSKQENVQCMVSESGCVKKGQGVSCFDCAFSIPNYYALSALGESLQGRLNGYLESQEQESQIPYYERRKRVRLFYIQLELFAQAIQRFGYDVYEFITDSREEFNIHLTKIGSLKEQYHLT